MVDHPIRSLFRSERQVDGIKSILGVGKCSGTERIKFLKFR